MQAIYAPWAERTKTCETHYQTSSRNDVCCMLLAVNGSSVLFVVSKGTDDFESDTVRVLCNKHQRRQRPCEGMGATARATYKIADQVLVRKLENVGGS